MSEIETPAATEHPLPWSVQQRNLLLFAGCVGMQYLAAPVLYVGGTHGVMVKELLKGSEFAILFANSPETLYLACTFFAVIIIGLFPGVRFLKPLLVGCYLVAALGAALVPLAHWLHLGNTALAATVVLQGLVTGLSIPTAIALVWEAMSRGVAESKRGSTLALAYGGGPILACLGSLGSQAILKGSAVGIEFGQPASFPGNFVLVFLAAVFPMLIAAFFASRFQLPNDVDSSEPTERVELFSGIRRFVSDPVLVRAAIVTVFLYAGNSIMANLTLHTDVAMSQPPEGLVMYQSAIRFGTKAIAGLILGWLLGRTTPRAGLIATGLIYALAPAYAAFATGIAYFLTFQIYGAGELVGVYAPNYILAASRPSQLRMNMAIANLLMAPAAPLGLLFGWVSDEVGAAVSPAAGYRTSFLMCSAFIGAGIVLALTWLPPRPVVPAD